MRLLRYILLYMEKCRKSAVNFKMREIMKKKWNVLVALALCVGMSLNVTADVLNENTEITANPRDYYMMVQSQDDGVCLYEKPDGRILLGGEKIPNGMPLHIEAEQSDSDGDIWGYTHYKDEEGYVPMDDMEPITLDEAIKAGYEIGGGHEVSYEVTIDSGNGSVWMYQGPGEKFGKTVPGYEYFNGESVYISEEVVSPDDGPWGKVNNGQVSGWIDLDETTWEQALEMETAGNAGVEKTDEEAEATLTEAAEVTPTEIPEVTPTEIPEVTPTEAAEVTPTEAVEATPTEAVEATPTETPEATPTETAEATPTEAAEPAETEEMKPTEAEPTEAVQDGEDQVEDAEQQEASLSVYYLLGLGVILLIIIGLLLWRLRIKNRKDS